MKTDDIAERLRESFLAEPSLVTTEEKLVDEFGVSRTPIREALFRLEHDGLITRRRGGISLRLPDAKEVADLYDMRAALEGYAAAAIVRSGALTSAAAKRLNAIAKRYEQALATGKKRQMIGHSMEFHTLVIETCGNLLLRQIWQKFAFQSRVISLAYAMPQPPARVDSNPWPHGKLAEVLREGSPEAAGQAFREHLLDTRKRLLQRLTGITI